MGSKLRVEIGLPKNGWIQFGISHGDQAFSIDASYTPYDSITDLTHAIAKLGNGIDAVTVSFNEEPTEFDLAFQNSGELVSLSVLSYPDCRRMTGTGCRTFECRGPRHEICLAFWRALRRLESQISSGDFERAWRHPFPSEKLSQVTEIVRQFRSG